MNMTFKACLALWLVGFTVIGCDRTSDYIQVDFSEKIQTGNNRKEYDDQKMLHVAVAAMISPKETLVYYEELLQYIGKQVGYEIQLVQRKTYSEINELFFKKKVDLAFLCSGPYATGREKYALEGLATPMVRGKPYYQAYLIVQKNSSYKNLEDLKGKVFAFTDPDSNTGNLVPRYWLFEINEDPAAFFNRVTYTYSHDNSIMAVAKGLVDAASVDGHKWEFYQIKDPYFTSKTRVIKKSDFFGSPPLVSSSAMDEGLKSKIRETILSMHENEEGRAILEKLLIDRFVKPQEEWYREVHTMSKKVTR